MAASGVWIDWATPHSPQGWLARVDAPALPQVTWLVALPPNATPMLHLSELITQPVTLPASWAKAEPVPLATLEEAGIVRGVRLARVTVHPIYGAAGQWQFVSRVRVYVDFGVAVQPDALTNDLLVLAAQNAVINSTQVARAPRPMGGRVNFDAPARFAISVKTEGLTALTYSDLLAAGVPLSNPINLQLWRANQQIAMQWEGDADAAFELGERLLFFAAPRFSRWSNEDVYWLLEGGAPGVRMMTRSAAPTAQPAGSLWHTRLLETNALYPPTCYCDPIPLGRDGDAWVWDELIRFQTKNYSLMLPTVDATQPASLTVWAIGKTDILTATLDHRLEVRVNGAWLGQAEWNGKTAITVTLPISPQVLLSGVNTVTLKLPGMTGINIDAVWLDALALNYVRGAVASGASAGWAGEAISRTYTLALTDTIGARAYDVSVPDQPVVLTDFSNSNNIITLSDAALRYFIAAELAIQTPVSIRLAQTAAPLTASDYLVIAPAEFVPALAPWLALRQGQGLAVTVENPQAIYDTWGDGRLDPSAIRAYIADAYFNLPQPPTYVLLVGDGTFDPKHYRGTSFATFIPPFLADVDPWMGEAAADNRYVTVDGNDALPDLLIGRWPVNTLTETQAIVNKVVQYETAPYPGGWNARAVFVADDADTGGDFPADMTALATTYITAPYTAPTLFLTPATFTTTRQNLLTAWANGAGLITYAGHSSPRQWATNPTTGAPLFHMTDAAALTNAPRWPVLMALTCFTGMFSDAGLSTLDETLVRNPAGGAVAVWSASGFGVATGHQTLAEGFLETLYLNHTPELGAAALAGKLRLAQSGQSLDLLDTYNLQGDPALALNLILVPWTDTLYLPVVRR